MAHVDAGATDKTGAESLIGPPSGRPTLRVHDLRHMCSSRWLGTGADPTVVQRIMAHASGAMTMDLHGHPIENLGDAAARFGGTTGHGRRVRPGNQEAPGSTSGV